jgi:hypothetical protein
MIQKSINGEKPNDELIEQKNYQENDKINEVGNQKQVYIFESPDKGKTIYKRPFGAPHNKREILKYE